MSDHPTPPDGPFESGVDRRLTTAVRDARTRTPGIDRDAFLMTAQTRRNRARRRRRVRTVVIPAVAIAIVAAAIGLITSGRANSSRQLVFVTGAGMTADGGDHAAIGCPREPGEPDTRPGHAMFDFVPEALTVCAFDTNGEAVAKIVVPGPRHTNVPAVLDELENDYVDQSARADEPHCAAGETPLSRLGVIASTDDGTVATAWIAVAVCSTPAGSSDRPSTVMPANAGSAEVEFTPEGDHIRVRVRPTGTPEWGEPQTFDGPNPSDAWLDHPIGLEKATIHVVMLPGGSNITNTAELDRFAIGQVPCGTFSCVVYEVARDSDGSPPIVRVSSDKGTSTFPLDQVGPGGGGLRGHIGG